MNTDGKSRYGPTALGLIFLAGYWLLFLSVGIPGIGPGGAAIRRADFFWLLLEPNILLDRWFGRPPQFCLADRLGLLAVAAGIVLSATAAGWLLLGALRADRLLAPLERAVFATAAGLSLLSSYVLVVGLLGGLHQRWLLLGPMIAVSVGAVCSAWRSEGYGAGPPLPPGAGRGAGNRSRTSEPPSPDLSQWKRSPATAGWLWLAAPFALLILLGSMLPPADFDVREYHLQAPKEFFQQGRIDFLPHNVYANMPLGTEMLSLLAMSLLGDWWYGALAGKTVIGAMSLVAALGLLAAGRRFFSPGAGVMAAVLYLSIPWIASVSTSGLVEGGLACYQFLAVYAMLLAVEAPDRRASLRLLALAGYLAGAAAACK